MAIYCPTREFVYDEFELASHKQFGTSGLTFLIFLRLMQPPFLSSVMFSS